MKKARQDAWMTKEDMVLADIVLGHIQHGKTQLEGFKKAAETLGRTPAACGFRWNAVIRKKHEEQIEAAKFKRKDYLQDERNQSATEENISIDSVITLLEEVKKSVKNPRAEQEYEFMVKKLEEENKRLRLEVKRYREAWQEMGNVWEWIHKENMPVKSKGLGQK